MAKKYLDQQGLQTLIQGLKAKNDALYAKAAHGHAASEVSYANANIKNGADIKVNEALDVLVANVIRASEDLSTTDGNVKELEKAINALKAQVGEGTVAKVAVELSGYSVAGKTGVSVKLKAVQIIDLVEFGGGSAESYGFGEEEGFEGTEIYCNCQRRPAMPINNVQIYSCD